MMRREGGANLMTPAERHHEVASSWPVASCAFAPAWPSCPLPRSIPKSPFWLVNATIRRSRRSNARCERE